MDAIWSYGYDLHGCMGRMDTTCMDAPNRKDVLAWSAFWLYGYDHAWMQPFHQDMIGLYGHTLVVRI